MNVFVTGGTGFVGANLVAALNKRGMVPRLLCRHSASTQALTGLQYQTVAGDVLSPIPALAEAMAGCDWVFHVAAVADYWRQKPERLYQVNVQGTKNMLEAAQLAKVKRFVFTSSVAALGVPAQNEPLTESHTFNLPPAALPYGHSKHLAEIAVRQAVAQGLEAVIVNPSIILGARDLNQISGSIILEIAKGRVWFNPPGGNNYIDVGDVATGHIAAAEQGLPGERYILGNTNLLYPDLIRLICEQLGKTPPTVNLPGWILPAAAVGVQAARFFLGNRLPIDENQIRMSGVMMYVDAGKAIRQLGLPQTPIRHTIRETCLWYQANGFL